MNKEHVIVEAKAEYTKQLITLLTEPVYTKIMQLYEKAEETTQNKRELLMNVQKELKAVPLWNQAQINNEVEKITVKCDWIGDLIAAIFISNVKILTSVKIGSDKKKIKITMPKTDHFIHKVFINTASMLYDNPYIFQSPQRKAEIIAIVKQSIEDTIRTLLPFQSILQSYLGDTLNDESESEEEEADDEEVEDEEETGEADVEAEEPMQPPMPPDVETFQNDSISSDPPMEQAPQPPPQSQGGFFDPPEVKNVNVEPQNSAQSKFFNDAIEETP